jgi:hypothetical protein
VFALDFGQHQRFGDAVQNVRGDYLKNRRTKLDPASFGFSGSRRRTAGLRREELL